MRCSPILVLAYQTPVVGRGIMVRYSGPEFFIHERAILRIVALDLSLTFAVGSVVMDFVSHLALFWLDFRGTRQLYPNLPSLQL